MADYYVREEDGTSKYVLEDSSGDYLLETSTDSPAPDFIASVTAVYAPALTPAQQFPGFIASATSVYTPTLGFTGSEVISVAGTYSWLCPADVTQIYVECYGGGGGGAGGQDNRGYAGGGGGAYAENPAVPVTPGTTYTFTVGAGGAGGNSPANPGSTPGINGTDSTFTGDSSTTVTAKGGQGGQGDTAGDIGQGGQASASTGTTKHSGGNGGAAAGAGSGQSGAGGGASGNVGADGNAGGAVDVSQTGGAGANGGGSGGNGSGNHANNATTGSVPGGGGGGGANGFSTTEGGAAGATGRVVITTGIVAPFIASITTVYAPTFPIQVPFIGSVTAVYAPSIPAQISAPFIASVTVVYTPSLPEVNVPFISSGTRVYAVMSLFDPNRIFGGPGNGGESFMVELNANGVTSTATLVAGMGVGLGMISLTGDTGFPASVPFVVTIDSEQLYLFPRGGGNYSVKSRGMGNTTVAGHSAGANVDWGDTYYFALLATEKINASFTADIEGAGSHTYPGWLVCYDSSQAYLSGDRYPMHVTQIEGVFDAGAGIGGTSKLDGAQPNAICTPTGVSDDCAAALSNPARIDTDIVAGDVAVVSYTNPEASALDLGPRSCALQSWFGMKRVDTTDHDVTFTDPNGIVVDTTGTYDTFTGSVNDEWFNPSSTGVAPIGGGPTPNPVPFTTVTLPGTDRKFTYGSGGGGYDERGWPFGVLAVRQGNRRVPFWQAYDWHNFSYVYNGFGTDCSYAQVVVNRNGVSGSEPEAVLPGPQDIDGPNAVWDDGTYHFGVSWYVVIFSGPYLVIGPNIGGTTTWTSSGEPPPYVPGVGFPPVGPPVITPPSPPVVEGGSGGGIAPGVAGLHIWATSGKGFS